MQMMREESRGKILLGLIETRNSFNKSISCYLKAYDRVMKGYPLGASKRMHYINNKLLLKRLRVITPENRNKIKNI